MKKLLLSFLIILSFLLVSIVKANNNVYIKDITMIEKSDDVTINKEPIVNGLKMDFGFKFKNVGDYVKYKAIIINRDSEDYTLSSSDKNEDGYIKYDYAYENDNKVIVAGGEKIMYITITYAKEVPDELYKNGKYNETHSTNLAFYNNRLPMEEMKKIENPKTNSASIVLISLAILLSLIISFLLSSRKMRRYIGIFVIGVLLISPFIVYAIETIYITINTKVEIEKEYKFCLYDFGSNRFEENTYINGETWKDYITRNNEDFSDEDYQDFSFYSKEVIDCYINLYNNPITSEIQDDENWNTCVQLKNDWTDYQVTENELIKGKEEGCYHYSHK